MNILILASRCLKALAILGLCASAVHAQTVSINNVACTTGSVTFANNAIAVSATGACVNTVSVPAPTITLLNPATATPGSTVTVTGTNFTGAATVTVGGIAANGVNVASATSLTFTVPSVSAGSQSVVVTVSGQSSLSLPLTVQAVTPVITSFNPSTAAPGASVTITGTGFASGATVTVGGVNAPVASVTATSIIFTVPAVAATAQSVIVTVGGTASASATLSVTAATPVITSMNPASGAVGTALTITGTGFASGATVQVGGQNATVVGTPTSTSITATVPTLAAAAYPVVVTVAGVQATAPSVFTVTVATPTPTISACSGTVGGTFSLTGANFVVGQTSLTINGNNVTSPTVTTTSISGTVPAAVNAAGSFATIVTANGQPSASFSCTIAAQVAQGASVFVTSTDGFAIPFPSKAPSSAINPTPQHSGLNGANGNNVRQNAWSAPPSLCTNTTPAINRLWVHNLDFPKYLGSNAIEPFGIYANEALSYAFVAPPEGVANNLLFNENLAGTFAASFMSISSQPCDFNVAKLSGPGRDYCYNSTTGSNALGYYSTNGPLPFANLTYCKIIPGQTYYLNFRSQDGNGTPTQDACMQTTGSTSVPCGGLFQIK